MDCIVETQDGFDCIVDGVRYGTWSSRGAAKAGLTTERIRANTKRTVQDTKHVIVDCSGEERERLIGRWYQP